MRWRRRFERIGRVVGMHPTRFLALFLRPPVNMASTKKRSRDDDDEQARNLEIEEALQQLQDTLHRERFQQAEHKLRVRRRYAAL